jgi:hypothetical protein
MRRDLRFVTAVAAAAVLLVSCGHSHSAEGPKIQDNFGVQMARLNLWREAMFRFQRAVDISPGDAMAHNNLAVAYEANGDFEKARREYLEALKLEKGNQYIQKNYSRFVEFTSRNKKRTPPKAAATPAPPASGGPPVIAVPPADMGRRQPAGGAMPADPGQVSGTPEAGQPAAPTPPPSSKPSDQPPPAKPPGGGER